VEAAAMGLYDIYEKRVFPYFLDLAMKPLASFREETLSGASGHVLEIGFGTGLNLPYYPSGVERLTAIDPMDAVKQRVQERIAAAPFPVDRHALAADGGLPFEDDFFDCVTVTWTLCTIPDPVAALREMHRVTRDGSMLLFIEHGRSPDPKIERWQDRLNPIQKFVGCGCNLNRPMDQLVEQGGFQIEKLDRFDAPDVPRTHGHLYQGIARV
jgi:ubiquinone/menaquinone biosynthesis C-methylase UbiE